MIAKMIKIRFPKSQCESWPEDELYDSAFDTPQNLSFCVETP